MIEITTILVCDNCNETAVELDGERQKIQAARGENKAAGGAYIKRDGKMVDLCEGCASEQLPQAELVYPVAKTLMEVFTDPAEAGPSEGTAVLYMKNDDGEFVQFTPEDLPTTFVTLVDGKARVGARTVDEMRVFAEVDYSDEQVQRIWYSNRDKGDTKRAVITEETYTMIKTTVCLHGAGLTLANAESITPMLMCMKCHATWPVLRIE